MACWEGQFQELRAVKSFSRAGEGQTFSYIVSILGVREANGQERILLSKELGETQQGRMQIR